MATDETTISGDVERILAKLASLSSDLGLLKGAVEEVTTDGADNIEGAQNYVDSAIHDLRLALRDIENA